MHAATRKPVPSQADEVPPPWVSTICPRHCPAQRRGVPAGNHHQMETDCGCDTFCPCTSAIQAGIIARQQTRQSTYPPTTGLKPPEF